MTATWWDGSHDWGVTVRGHRLVRKDRLGKQGGGVALGEIAAGVHGALPGDGSGTK